MISQSQEEFLAGHPDKIISVQPFDPKAKEAGQALVRDLQSKLPNLEIIFGGSTPLGISGQNDLDINILSTPEEYSFYRPVLEEMFGPPTRVTKSIKWGFMKNGFLVDLYLTDKNSLKLQEQIKVFNLLSNSKQLREEYEKIKLPLGEQDYKTYMRKKYEFFNRILGLE